MVKIEDGAGKVMRYSVNGGNRSVISEKGRTCTRITMRFGCEGGASNGEEISQAAMNYGVSNRQGQIFITRHGCR